MTKFGWDLPPGVSTSMLPGNRPEELEAEAREEAIYERLSALGIKDEDLLEKLVKIIYEFEDAAWSKGYADAETDAGLAEP